VLASAAALAMPVVVRVPIVKPHGAADPADAGLFPTGSRPISVFRLSSSHFSPARKGFTHDEMDEGRFCGACHNGQSAPPASGARAACRSSCTRNDEYLRISIALIAMSGLAATAQAADPSVQPPAIAAPGDAGVASDAAPASGAAAPEPPKAGTEKIARPNPRCSFPAASALAVFSMPVTSAWA